MPPRAIRTSTYPRHPAVSCPHDRRRQYPSRPRPVPDDLDADGWAGGAAVERCEAGHEGGGVTASVGMMGADELASPRPVRLTVHVFASCNPDVSPRTTPGGLVANLLSSGDGTPASAGPGSGGGTSTSSITTSIARPGTSSASAARTSTASAITGTPHLPRTWMHIRSRSTRTPGTLRPGR